MTELFKLKFGRGRGANAASANDRFRETLDCDAYGTSLDEAASTPTGADS
jgi:hypothetical protein